MLELLGNFAVKLLGRFIPATIRWYYTPKRMEDLVRARLAPEGDGVQLWASDLPHATAWVVVTNLSPFPIELDRAALQITFGAPVLDITSLRRVVIRPSSEETLLFRAPLTIFQTEYIRKHQTQVNQIGLNFDAFILCRVNNFSAQKNVSTAHFKLFNFTSPLSTWVDLSGDKAK